LAHAHRTAPTQSELDRLDYARSVPALGQPTYAPDTGAAGAEPPPYLENPLDTYATYADQDAQLQAELAGQAAPPQQDPAEAEAEAVDAWTSLVDRRKLLSTLRAAVEHATAPIVDKTGQRQACGVDGELQEHAEDGRRRFVVWRCHRRDRCPECAVTYGEERGEELGSLLDALATIAPKRKGYPAGFGLEVTVPEPVTRYIGDALDRGDYHTAKVALRRLTKIARTLVWDAVKRRGLERGDVGAAVNVHAFHSRSPLTGGWHFHVHVTIPNVTRTGEYLRRYGRLGRLRDTYHRKAWRGRSRLALLRHRLRELVLREFGADVDLSGLANVNLYWHFFGGSRVGWRGFRKRALYVNRSPWHDVAKIAAKNPMMVYSDAGLALLAKFAERAETVQTALKVRRYLGWLSPGQRSKWGIVKDPGDKSPWRALPGGYRRIIRFDATGLWLRRFDSAGETAEHLEGAMVSWSNTSPPRRWQTASQRDAKAERQAEAERQAAANRSQAPGPASAVAPGLFGMVPA